MWLFNETLDYSEERRVGAGPSGQFLKYRAPLGQQRQFMVCHELIYPTFAYFLFF